MFFIIVDLVNRKILCRNVRDFLYIYNMKKLIYLFLAVSLLSCEKEVDSNNTEEQDDCKCGIVISVEYDSAISGGQIQNRYDVKARNECSNNVKEFTQVPDNGDYVPSEGEYWCRNNTW